jgi:hypothetical protein
MLIPGTEHNQWRRASAQHQLYLVDCASCIIADCTAVRMCHAGAVVTKPGSVLPPLPRMAPSLRPASPQQRMDAFCAEEQQWPQQEDVQTGQGGCQGGLPCCLLELLPTPQHTSQHTAAATVAACCVWPAWMKAWALGHLGWTRPWSLPCAGVGRQQHPHAVQDPAPPCT